MNSEYADRIDVRIDWLSIAFKGSLAAAVAIGLYYAFGFAKQVARENERIEYAKSEVRKRMKDPDSVTFKDIATKSRGSIIRGRYNARNGYGGYTGYKCFSVIGDDWVDIEATCR